MQFWIFKVEIQSATDLLCFNKCWSVAVLARAVLFVLISFIFYPLFSFFFLFYSVEIQLLSPLQCMHKYAQYRDRQRGENEERGERLGGARRGKKEMKKGRGKLWCRGENDQSIRRLQETCRSVERYIFSTSISFEYNNAVHSLYRLFSLQTIISVKDRSLRSRFFFLEISSFLTLYYHLAKNFKVLWACQMRIRSENFGNPRWTI